MVNVIKRKYSDHCDHDDAVSDHDYNHRNLRETDHLIRPQDELNV